MPLPLVVLLGLIALTSIAPAPATAQQPTDADAIVDRARRAWSLEPEPRRVSYRLSVVATVGDTTVARHYRGIVAGRDAYHVARFSEGEQRAPSTPRGVALFFSLSLNGRKASHRVLTPASGDDLLGLPNLTPFYDFGFAHTPASTAARTDAASGPEIIGRVTGTTRRYAATLIGIETVEGRAAYHVRLSPLRDPQSDRIRDVWVDQATDATLRMITAGNFTARPSTAIPWSIDFDTSAGVTHIQRECAVQPLAAPRGGAYFPYCIAFSDIATLPPSTVDPIVLRLPPAAGELREP